MLFEHGPSQIWLVLVYLGLFSGPEGGPYGPKCVLQSIRTPTRKANMMKIFFGRSYARMTTYYAIWAWIKANLFSLGTFELVFEPEGGPLRPQMCATVHPDANKEGGHNVDFPWEILGWPLTMLFERGQIPICLVRAYLGLFFSQRGPLWPRMCSTIHLETEE